MMPEKSQDYMLIGYCDRAEREAILPYNQRVVEVNGEKGVLLTFHLRMETPADRNLVAVMFDHPDKYRVAPRSVQRVVDCIEWATKLIV